MRTLFEPEVLVVYQLVGCQALDCHVALVEVEKFVDPRPDRQHVNADQRKADPLGPGQDRIHLLASIFATYCDSPKVQWHEDDLAEAEDH